MKNHELVSILQNLNPDADVRVLSSHHEGDDILDWQITCVHDHFTLATEHDMVSIEITFDERPHTETYPRYDDEDRSSIESQLADKLIERAVQDGLVTLSLENGVQVVTLTELGKVHAAQLENLKPMH